MRGEPLVTAFPGSLCLYMRCSRWISALLRVMNSRGFIWCRVCPVSGGFCFNFHEPYNRLPRYLSGSWFYCYLNFISPCFGYIPSCCLFVFLSNYLFTVFEHLRILTSLSAYSYKVDFTCGKFMLWSLIILIIWIYPISSSMYELQLLSSFLFGQLFCSRFGCSWFPVSVSLHWNRHLKHLWNNLSAESQIFSIFPIS